MTILNDFLYYYENGSKIISPWGKEMIPLLLISYCPTYKLPKNHNESSSSFFWVVTTLGLQCWAKLHAIATNCISNFFFRWKILKERLLKMQQFI